MDSYSKRDVVAVRIQLRKVGMDGCGRERYPKSWILKNVTFTLDTESPTRYGYACTNPFALFIVYV